MLVENDNLPHLFCQMGKILNAVEEKKNIVLTAVVRLSNTTL